MVIQVYALTSNAEEAEIERFYEDLQDLLELTPQKDVLFIIGDWNAKVGSQEIPGVTGMFGLGVQNCLASIYSSVFVSSQQRFGMTDIKVRSACYCSWVLDRPCYSSQVMKRLCYSS